MKGLFGVSAQVRARVEVQREPLYRLAYSWCHDAALADDMVQETMLRALGRAGQLRDHAKLKPAAPMLSPTTPPGRLRHRRSAR